MRVVGFDSRLSRRPVEGQSDSGSQGFKANLGVSVTVNDYDSFVDKYDAFLETLFREHGIERKQLLYKSKDLTEVFYGLGINLIPIIAEKILELVDHIDIYYSYFPEEFEPGKKLKIRLFYDDHEEDKTVSNVEFVDILQGPFPAICCYSYLKVTQDLMKGTLYHIDDCPGLLPSNATTHVISHTHTRFLFKGDQVNYAVNAADILCRHVDDLSMKLKAYLNNQIIEKFKWDPKKCSTTFIGDKWLYDLKPSRNTPLNISHKYPHPIFFFFKDTSSPFLNQIKDTLENSVLFRLALNRAAKAGGSVKFFQPADQQFITKEDFLVQHGTESLDKAEQLKRLGCPASIMDFSSLTQN